MLIFDLFPVPVASNGDEMNYTENFDLQNLETPVDVNALIKALKDTNYDPIETSFLQDGFANGFDIGYEGPQVRQSRSKNIPLKVGNKVDLWNKLIKEVKLKRVAGPYDKIPFDNYIQSPIGLLPKAGSKDQTRLIFHLSYDFKDEKSVNHHTPAEKCSVKYKDLDFAVRACLKMKYGKQRKLSDLGLPGQKEKVGNIKQLYAGKSNIKSAFRILPLKRKYWKWLIMIAENPQTGKLQFFVEKCLPFGLSISCAHFQRFSNALCWITEVRTQSPRNSITNYLDDFLFLALSKLLCDWKIRVFLKLCDKIGVPIALEKTEWSQTLIVFLGILLDLVSMKLCIPEGKRLRAIEQLKLMIDKKKATVKELQTLCGFLNFLNKAIYPGRAFTRHMHTKYSNIIQYSSKQKKDETAVVVELQATTHHFKWRQFHHVKLDKEFKFDCKVWLMFLTHPEFHRVVNRPMIDVDAFKVSEQICFYSDASVAKELGFGCIYNSSWIFKQWEPNSIADCEPSIEFLELYGLIAGVLTWQKQLANCRITIFCDNMAVVYMVNNTNSSCARCMYLIRILILNNMLYNRKIQVKFVPTKQNYLADALSRLKITKFKELGPNMNELPNEINCQIWPVTKIWENSFNF